MSGRGLLLLRTLLKIERSLCTARVNRREPAAHLIRTSRLIDLWLAHLQFASTNTYVGCGLSNRFALLLNKLRATAHRGNLTNHSAPTRRPAEENFITCLDTCTDCSLRRILLTIVELLHGNKVILYSRRGTVRAYLRAASALTGKRATISHSMCAQAYVLLSSLARSCTAFPNLYFTRGSRVPR